MPSISFEDRTSIITQALKEIDFSREFKQGKVKNWKVNEDLYYGKKIATNDSRANVDLGKMASFLHTTLSKIDNPLLFKFMKQKEAQLMRAKRLNALRQVDQQKDNWDIKDLVGKKQALMYGRAIYAYHADSYNGYCAHLENVDVYDFLVDPSAGGIDLEQAMFLGRYGVVKSRQDIEEGMKGKDGIYLKTEGKRLLECPGNATDVTRETMNQQSRTRDMNVWNTDKNIQNEDKFVFWEWYTTWKGERYYLLITEKGGTAIRIEKLTDIFESGLYPFWTWAAFPDLTEFWTPSYCDYVREVFMAQAVSINQMLDNAEAINKPMRVVNVKAIENMAELKFRKDGIIKTKGEYDANRAIQTIAPVPINSPIEVFNLLEGIQEKASGVTAGAQGVADEDKVGIYQGNQANAADRFGLLNRSYSFGYKVFARLYEAGVREHLTKKVAIEILGPNGVQLEMVNKRDIFHKNDTFGIIVEASNAEDALSEEDKKNKLTFLQTQALNQTINQKKAFELQASIAGFNEEEIRQLLDTSEFGDAELMSEAERDIEIILDGKKLTPNQAATNAYKQRMVDYMLMNAESIDSEQFQALTAYIQSLMPIIARNMVRQANDLLTERTIAQALTPVDPNAPVGGATAPAPMTAPMTAPVTPPASAPIM